MRKKYSLKSRILRGECEFFRQIEKWKFNSPARERKKWIISSRNLFEIENLVSALWGCLVSLWWSNRLVLSCLLLASRRLISETPKSALDCHNLFSDWAPIGVNIWLRVFAQRRKNLAHVTRNCRWHRIGGERVEIEAFAISRFSRFSRLVEQDYWTFEQEHLQLPAFPDFPDWRNRIIEHLNIWAFEQEHLQLPDFPDWRNRRSQPCGICLHANLGSRRLQLLFGF